MTWIAKSPAITLMVTQKHSKFSSQPVNPLCMCTSFLQGKGRGNEIRNLAIGIRLCLLTNMNEKDEYLGLPRSKEKRQFFPLVGVLNALM